MKSDNRKRKGGLGRGMDALFTPFDEDIKENEVVEEIELKAIRPNPYQPRKHFDEEALEELAASIKQTGVLQPVILRRSTIRGYELIAGERRVRASKLAGKTTIPAIVRDLDEEEMIEYAIVENLQREDLTPLEEAEAYQVMMDKLSLTQAETAERMGKSRSYIANYTRLLSLPDEVKKYVNEGKLSMAQARTLLGIKDEDTLTEMAKRVLKEGLTVRQLEEEVKNLNQDKTKEETKQEKAQEETSGYLDKVYVSNIKDSLEDKFGTTVRIKQKGKSGKIEVEYTSMEDLTRLLEILEIQL